MPEIKNRALPEIVLEILAHLNSMNQKKERLIEITFDGKIDKNEIDDFIRCIKTGDKNQQNIDYAVETSKIMQAIYDSSESHSEIKIN